EVRVCRDMSCHLRGSVEFQTNLEALAEEVGAGEVVVSGVSCLGQCDGAPALLIGDHVVRKGALEKVRFLLRMALRNAGELAVDGVHGKQLAPTGWKIDPYEGREDYAAVRRFAANPDTEGLLEQL